MIYTSTNKSVLAVFYTIQVNQSWTSTYKAVVLYLHSQYRWDRGKTDDPSPVDTGSFGMLKDKQQLHSLGDILFKKEI